MTTVAARDVVVNASTISTLGVVKIDLGCLAEIMVNANDPLLVAIVRGCLVGLVRLGVLELEQVVGHFVAACEGPRLTVVASGTNTSEAIGRGGAKVAHHVIQCSDVKVTGDIKLASQPNIFHVLRGAVVGLMCLITQTEENRPL